MTVISDQERIELGKKGKLWRMEVYGRVGNEIFRQEVSNKTSAEIRELRAYIYEMGLARPVDPGHWVVIHPQDILEVHLWRQNTYFDAPIK